MAFLRFSHQFNLQIQMKIIAQGLLIVATFSLLYFGLRQIDWITLLNIKSHSKALDKKLGDTFWKFYNQTAEEIKTPKVKDPIDSIVTRLCENNDIDKDELKIKIVQNEEVNAFALPGGYMVINSALIKEAKTPEELAGVIGHELAHIQLDHVMKKLGKEFSLAILINTVSGGNGQVVYEAIRLLSSTAFDRKLEKEADYQSVKYMKKANINACGLADFMEQLSISSPSANAYLSWISTHPDMEERVAYLKDICHISDDNDVITPVLSDNTWKSVKASLP
jgi:predicted Zn-dependent protease